jgi:hypothetical protein
MKINDSSKGELTRALVNLPRLSGPVLATILLISGALSAESVLAASETEDNKSSYLSDKFYLAIGGYFPSVDSDIRLDPPGGGSGTDFDLENELGLASTTATPFVYFRWRFSPRHRLELDYLALNRDGTAVASKDFTIGDTSGSAAVRLDTTFDLGIGRATYGYSFIKDSKKELGILAGHHLADTGASIRLQGMISIGGGTVTNNAGKEGGDLFLPLPHIGGFKYFNVVVADSGDDLNGEFDLNSPGPALYLSANS